MADDTGKEPLESNANDQPDPPKEIIPVKETETITPIQQTKNMEVHKHPHHVTHKKKWGEYLLEFFMLFLAVFLGFVTENAREHNVESRNTKEYIEAYRNDLIRNQRTIQDHDSLYSSLLPVYDSICNIYYTKRENTEIKSLERFLFAAKRNILTQISTPTYTQLLNSGGLKYIRSVALRDSMAAYYDLINRVRDYDLRMIQLKNAIYPAVLEIEDMHSFWKINAADPENIQGLIPDMDLFEPMTGGQRRVTIGYYRQFFIQMRSNHSFLKQIMRMNKNLVDLIDKK
jgi:hypothetical protein